MTKIQLLSTKVNSKYALTVRDILTRPLSTGTYKKLKSEMTPHFFHIPGLEDLSHKEIGDSKHS